MGGFNSSRWHGHSVKAVVEDCHVLCSVRWTREGILRDGVYRSGGLEWRNPQTGEVLASISYVLDMTSESPTVQLRYTSGKEILAYHVPILSTRPNYGGVKWWFGCPACRRRVRKLYLPPGQRYFACRRCYRLAYEVQRKDAQGRAIEKARKIRLRLGGSRNLLESFPAIPKGMWWRTYLRLRTEATAAEWREIGFFSERIGRRQKLIQSEAIL